MITVDHSVTISRPVGEVFVFVSNPENDSQWQSGLIESRQTSEGARGVGSTGVDVRQFLGRRIESTFEITEYEDNSKLSFKVVSGPIPMEGRYTFNSAGVGTKIDFRIQGEPGGLFRLAEALLGRMVKRQIEADMSNLKDLLEAQG